MPAGIAQFASKRIPGGGVDLPCLTFMGGHEQIVDRKAIRKRMANWPKGQLVEIPDGEHEVLMEGPEVRGKVYQQISDLFQANHPNGQLKSA